VRKFWPLTQDDFSIRLWAALSSAFLNLVGLLCCLWFGVIKVLWLVGFPGALAFLLINGSIEEASSVWWVSIGIAAWVFINLVFYYYVVRFVISAFQPVKDWWPERQS
jgi:hypothetical protein